MEFLRHPYRALEAFSCNIKENPDVGKCTTSGGFLVLF
jgi:hypothetical protein